MRLPAFAISLTLAAAATAQTLPGTRPLDWEGDLAARMVAGIDAFLEREIQSAIRGRDVRFERLPSDWQAHNDATFPLRNRFRAYIGAVDARGLPEIEFISTFDNPSLIGEAETYKVYAVRWPAFGDVHGEGLLLEPNHRPLANIVALGDCDWTPERLAGLVEGVPQDQQFARRLAENGCRVVIPTLINRADTYSGHPDVRYTNQPHREFIYRGAYEMGRHIIGYEVQKVSAAIDWFLTQEPVSTGVVGYGEGGLIAFHAAAVDERIKAAVVSGYFGPRDTVWQEPIYRNVWAQLTEFTDPEIAQLIAPRTLIIEASDHPEIDGPPEARDGRSGAAPGAITTPAIEAVQAEFKLAADFVKYLDPAPVFTLINASDGQSVSSVALLNLVEALGVELKETANAPTRVANLPDPDARMKRQFDELVEHNQQLLRNSAAVREDFWRKADTSSVENFVESAKWYREYFSQEVIGEFPNALLPPTAQSRQVFETDHYTGYEIVLDVWPDEFPGVFAYGLLLLPKNIAEGERRPVVVCQHGLEGRPHDLADPSVSHDAYGQYGCKLAEEGFVVFAPQNPYIGGDDFRVLQRKANPLKKSLFSVITRQHERIIEWLADQPFVDPERIAFYGLSYGGKTAMRVPALLEGYCLSICSADFNEWIWKNVAVDNKYSYIFTGEYEMFEFDLGHTFNYAEMAKLIFPRPFMVERGHHDGVAPDEQVAYEYAKVRRLYNLFNVGDRTTIEFFNGPHRINAEGTFDF
jgi:dienelactone hydrolase